jgi:hypothetical protein
MLTSTGTPELEDPMTINPFPGIVVPAGRVMEKSPSDKI